MAFGAQKCPQVSLWFQSGNLKVKHKKLDGDFTQTCKTCQPHVLGKPQMLLTDLCSFTFLLSSQPTPSGLWVCRAWLKLFPRTPNQSS